MALKYKDLFIDFDDTLYDTHGNANIALSQLVDKFNFINYFDDPNVFYTEYWKANAELWAKYAKGEITRPYLIIERFRRPLSLGLPNVTDEYCLKISDLFLELCSNQPGVVEGAHELMEYLKIKGYRMHICSNGFHEVQYKKLRACQLFEYFNTIILSEDAGNNKPSQQYFNYAFKLSGAKPETTIMIGDNFITDIKGAKEAGLDTIFFNRHSKEFIAPEHTTFEVYSLKEIKYIL